MTVPDPRALLDALDEALAKATPGPWWAWDRGVGWHIVTEDPATVGRGSVPVTLPEGMRTDLARGEDAAAIVAAVNALPALTAAVRAALALADELDRNVTPRSFHPAGTHSDGVSQASADAATRLRSTVTAALTGGTA